MLHAHQVDQLSWFFTPRKLGKILILQNSSGTDKKAVLKTPENKNIFVGQVVTKKRDWLETKERPC